LKTKTTSLQLENPQVKDENKELKTKTTSLQLENQKIKDQEQQIEKQISDLKKENESLQIKLSPPSPCQTILPVHQKINFNDHNAIISHLRQQNQNLLNSLFHQQVVDLFKISLKMIRLVGFQTINQILGFVLISHLIKFVFLIIYYKFVMVLFLKVENFRDLMIN
jgi:hypothetical protein